MNDCIKKIYDELKIDISYGDKKGFPYIGRRGDESDYSFDVSKIEKAWYYYDYDLYNIKPNKDIIKLGSGDPIKYKPYLPCIKRLKDSLNDMFYYYGPAAGDECFREDIAKYLIKIGFNNIDYNNVIITPSTTNGFYLILKSIFKEHDVIIMTSPCYGLFAFMPERLNIDVHMIKLEKEDNYFINTVKLSKLINRINNKLKKEYGGSDYIPRVKAFLNINPHNPLGCVIGKNDINILDELGALAIKNNMFIIDDLIYRDLSYDRNNIAIPIGTLDNYFDYSISLFGLSKSYNMANTRSGFIVANRYIISLIRNNLFYEMDSAPYIQACLLSGAFNINNEKEYNDYFNDLINQYIFKRDLVLSLVNGINSISKSNNYNLIKELLINNNCSLNGIKYVNIDIIPMSGFFAILNFNELKSHSNIKSEKDLLFKLYEYEGLKFLIGESISWPNKNDIIARITYSLDNCVIIDSMKRINDFIERVVK